MIELVTACNRCFVRQAPRALPRPDGNRYREPFYSSTCHQTQGCHGAIVFTSEEALEAERQKGKVPDAD